jgi:hypothetical protein
LYDLGERYAILAEPGDYRTLANEIRKAIEDPRQWDEMVQNAKLWSEEHDLLWTADKIKTHIELSIPR